ncbi:hypothetical protein CSC2_18380 [Clostridium zeae]|uniref:Ger(X)C family spore germination protein n=1 Tax=Clostridium zeae TaxID=2759022 RepID=A0ABQ1E939_9CLOT|nr:Ger(x)C family spore germination protein [Clostridium zeae]GFZ31312.1 hypothetical protein CSC2_18380 [Clostridium zeae]
MRKSSIVLFLISVLIIIICFIGAKGELVENLELPVGLGADLDRSAGQIRYSVQLLTYSIGGTEQLAKKILEGKATTLGETRQVRQLQSDKKLTLGATRVYVFSEDVARYGLRPWIDINLNNAFMNDRAMCVVCKGTAREMFDFDISGYASSVEYIEGMVKNSEEYNFFKMQYSLNDIIVRIDSEGRNVLLPYVEIDGDKLKFTGLAVFNKDKMIDKADMRETRVINMLKENRVKGIFTIENNPKEYINLEASSKRKVKCVKVDGKYKFTINLDINGEVVSNELYENIYRKNKDIKKFEKDMENNIEKQCNDLINEIKGKYQTDVLDLGRVAVAKYGRKTGADWDKIVSQSEIEVKVKVKVRSLGRGSY